MDDWANVRPGDVVLGAKDQKAWEVIERFDNGQVTIRNAAGRQHTLPVKGPVQIVATAAEIMAAAEATVKITLPGSEVIARIDNETGVHRTPPTFRESGSAQAHCYVLHGKRSTADNLLDILAEHARWHEDNDVLRPHVHVKDFEV